MNIIANTSLTTFEGEFGPIIPTYILTSDIMLAVRQILQPPGKLECLLSWHANNLLRTEEDPTRYERLLPSFDFHIDLKPARHDIINGVWIRRTPGTLEYENATCEDTLLLSTEDHNKWAMIRHRRLFHFDPRESPCY